MNPASPIIIAGGATAVPSSCNSGTPIICEYWFSCLWFASFLIGFLLLVFIGLFLVGISFVFPSLVKKIEDKFECELIELFGFFAGIEILIWIVICFVSVIGYILH